MANPTPHQSSPPRIGPTADIAADDDAPASPVSDSLPVRLSYATDGDGKRQASPNRGVDGVSSPPKNRRNTRPSPRRTVSAVSTSDSDGAGLVFDLFDVSPRSVERPTSRAVVMTPAQSKQLAAIIKIIRSTPVTARRAILPISRRKPPASKAQKAKHDKPSNKKPKKKPTPVLGIGLISRSPVRSHIFGATKVLNYSKKEMLDHDRAFQKQLKHRFAATRKTKHSVVSGVTTRSNTDSVDLNTNEDAYQMRTTNFKQLSRYVLDDVVASPVDTPFLLCISKSLDNEFSKYLSDSAKQQRLAGIAGDNTTISGRQYFTLRVSIEVSNYHSEIVNGQMALKTFANMYGRQEGIGFRIVGTSNPKGEPYKINLPWHYFVDRAIDIMLFGQPLASFRSFDLEFQMKNDMQYVFHTFKELACEYWGDATASAQLYAAYLKRVSQLRALEVEDMKTSIPKRIFRQLEEMTLSQKVFTVMFDGLCKNEFQLCMSSWNDYGSAIVLEEDLDRYIWAAEHVAFPLQWKMLAGMRGLKEKHERQKDQVGWKKRQIFFQLLSIIRMKNAQHLSWWAMIQSVANFGWGVGATAGDINAYWGVTVSSTTRSDRLSDLTSHIIFRYRHLLKQSRAKLFCFDNYQVGQPLTDQRGGHSAAFLAGTNQVAHQVREYTDTSNDNVRVPVTGLNDQRLPSLPGMARYDLAPPNEELGDFITDHRSMVGSPTIDSTGQVVEDYIRVLRLTYMNDRLQYAFGTSDNHVDSLPGKRIDKEITKQFARHCKSDGAKAFFNENNNFQKNACEKFDPHREEVTKSLMLGFVGIDEGSKTGAGTVTLDLLLKGGTMNEVRTGQQWDMPSDAASDRNMIYGDRKSIELMQAFANDLKSRGISLSEASEQCEEFEQALKTIQALPGDWHMGLNSAQTIFKCFYKPLLQPIQDLLKWKKINEQVRGCYYQAVRLIKFVNEELHRLLLQIFVEERWNRYSALFADEHTNDNNIFCTISNDYQQYLRDIEDRELDDDEDDDVEDEFLRMCALFLHMSDDLFLFVQSYRNADPIATVKGYDWFVPAWTATNQNKYVAGYHEQLRELLINHPYSRYVEAMLNRFVRTHPASTGKGAVAHDEYLELMNRLFAMFPKMRTLKGMARIGFFIGLAQRCKRFCQSNYVKTDGKKDRQVTMSGSHADQTPERRAIYELFSIMFDGDYGNRGRVASVKSINRMVSKVQTKLKNQKLEDKIKAVSECTATRLLNGVLHIWSEDIMGTSKGDAHDGNGESTAEMEEIETILAQEEAMEGIVVRETSVDFGDVDEDATIESENKLPVFSLKSAWNKGVELMAAKNYIAVTAAGDARKNRKRAVSKFIIKKVKEMKAATSTDVGVDRTDVVTSPWSDYMHSLDPIYYSC